MFSQDTHKQQQQQTKWFLQKHSIFMWYICYKVKIYTEVYVLQCIHTCHTSPLDWLSLRWHLCACRRSTSCCWINFLFSGSAVDVAVVGVPPCAPPGAPPWVAAWGPGWLPLGAPDCGWAGDGAGGVACCAIPPSFPPTPTTDEPPKHNRYATMQK
jgi:hypothetical protein